MHLGCSSRCSVRAGSSSRRATRRRSGRSCRWCSRSSSCVSLLLPRVLDRQHVGSASTGARARSSARSRSAALWLWFRPLRCAAAHAGRRANSATALVARARRGQPRVLRAAPRQELLLLASGSSFLAYRVIGGTALVAGDPIGDPSERRRAGRRVHPRRPREGLAGRDRRGFERGARGLRGTRLQVDVPRRRGRDQAVRVLARRSRDPQGAPVGLAAREERVRGSRAVGRRRRPGAAPRARGRLARSGAATGRSGASRWRWTRCLPIPTRARGRARADRRRRGLPAARSVARKRRLLARLDAPSPRHAERPDGVPDHRDGRLGARARRRRAVAQLLGVRRLPARRRGRRAVWTRATALRRC